MNEQQLSPEDITPEEFVALVDSVTDEQLAEGLKANRDTVLEGIFTGMADHFDPNSAEGVTAVVDWCITGREDGGQDRWQVVVRDKQCAIAKDGSETPTITMELDCLDFVKLAASKIAGPELFMSGRMKIQGDMMLAARLQGLFNPPPRPASEAGGEAEAGEGAAPATGAGDAPAAG